MNTRPSGFGRRAWQRLFALGAAPVLLNVAVAVQPEATPTPIASTSTPENRPSDPPAVKTKRVISAVAILAVIGGIVAVGGVIAGIGAARAMRRARAALLRQRPAPSPTDDVWSKHVVPELDDTADESEPGVADR